MKIKKFVDLSLPLNEKTPVYPGDPIPKFNVATTVENDGYNLFGVYVGSQSGSHVDASYHFLNSGKRVDEMSLDNFFGRAMLIDMSHKMNNEEITYKDIKSYLPEVKNKPFILIKTGWDKTIGTDAFFEHPYVGEDAAIALVEHGAVFLGMDTINVDKTGGTEFPVHDLFALKDLMIGENWANFGEITGTELYLSAFPLNMNCDGSPVRPVVIEVEV